MSTSLGTKTKDPDETLDYPIDWSHVLTTGETVASAAWDVPTGLTQPRAPTLVTPLTTVWLSGGTDGVSYIVGCLMTTSAGRVFDRSFTLKVRQK